MCTVTWLHRPDGYDLLCNRDERISRRRAEPVALGERRGVRYLAPADGDFGGTWIAVNEHGVALCLLNGYGEETAEPVGGWTSRGLVVLELVTAASAAEARAAAVNLDLGRSRPFVLAILEPRRPTLVVRWNGRSLELDAAGSVAPPLVSSSFDPEGVAASRARLLEDTLLERGAGASRLERFHRSHEPERGAYSPCMHRDDASTVSLSVVSVGRESIEFAYVAGAPCSGAMPVTAALARVDLAVAGAGPSSAAR